MADSKGVSKSHHVSVWFEVPYAAELNQGAWVARRKDLPLEEGFGDTPREALKDLLKYERGETV